MAIKIDENLMLKKGTVLDRCYRIVDYLASGGFGNTYVAEHITLGTKVAIKEFFMKGINSRDNNDTTVSVALTSNKEIFEGQKKFKKLANEEDPVAQYNLGRCYANGFYTTKDDKEAFWWYQKAADNGDYKAFVKLGNRYYEGKGIEKDTLEALDLYQKGFKEGDPEAYGIIAEYYAEGNGGLEKDEAKSQDIYHKLFSFYEKNAKQGNAVAQTCLGYCYYHGNGVGQDYKEAVEWYRKAAEQGNAVAQYNLGYCYENGQGVPQSREDEVKWCKRAAKQGNEIAIQSLKKLGESVN